MKGDFFTFTKTWIITKTTAYFFGYIGALINVSLVFFYTLFIESNFPNCLQVLGYVLLTAHYLKRVLESFYVHRPSTVTMSVFVLIFIGIYYWILGAWVIGYSIFCPSYSKPNYSHPLIPIILTVLFLCFEYMNYRCHKILRDLRPPDSDKKGIPYGSGFDWVSAANYFWELCSWMAFACLFRTIAATVFCILGFFAMVFPAMSSHKWYNEYFDGKKNRKYPQNRKAMIPLIL